VNLQNVVPVCGGVACNPVPVVLRPPDEYLWEESPFQLSGGGSGIIETAGVDYISAVLDGALLPRDRADRGAIGSRSERGVDGGLDRGYVWRKSRGDDRDGFESTPAGVARRSQADGDRFGRHRRAVRR